MTGDGPISSRIFFHAHNSHTYAVLTILQKRDKTGTSTTIRPQLSPVPSHKLVEIFLLFQVSTLWGGDHYAFHPKRSTKT